MCYYITAELLCTYAKSWERANDIHASQELIHDKLNVLKKTSHIFSGSTLPFSDFLTYYAAPDEPRSGVQALNSLHHHQHLWLSLLQIQILYFPLYPLNHTCLLQFQQLILNIMLISSQIQHTVTLRMVLLLQTPPPLWSLNQKEGMKKKLKMSKLVLLLLKLILIECDSPHKRQHMSVQQQVTTTNSGESSSMQVQTGKHRHVVPDNIRMHENAANAAVSFVQDMMI